MQKDAKLKFTKAELVEQIEKLRESLQVDELIEENKELKAFQKELVEENIELKQKINSFPEICEEIVNSLVPFRNPEKLNTSEKLLLIKRKYG